MFKKALPEDKKLKILIWGGSGTGKTEFALHFPSPAIIDMERGSDLYAEKFDFYRYRANSFVECQKAIKFLGTEKHPFQTLIIDPVTVVWEKLQLRWDDIFLRDRKSTKSNKGDYYIMNPLDWAKVKKEWRDFIIDCLNLNMNVVFIAREKDEVEKNGNELNKVGERYDAEKSLEYYVDLSLHFKKKEDKFVCERGRTRGNLKDLPEKFETKFSIIEKYLDVSLCKNIAEEIKKDTAWLSESCNLKPIEKTPWKDLQKTNEIKTEKGETYKTEDFLNRWMEYHKRYNDIPLVEKIKYVKENFTCETSKEVKNEHEEKNTNKEKATAK